MNTTHIQSVSPGTSYAAPSAGVITSWSFHAPSAGPAQVKFKVVRPAGGADFTTVGDSSLETAPAGVVSTFPTRISVHAGDVIGLLPLSGGACFNSASPPPGYAFMYVPGDPPPGTTVTYTGSPPVPLDIAAVLEPDCDEDGFGDETQDDDIRACPPGPSAAITSAPADKVKTKKKRKNVTFAFNANEPGAAFNCVLDGKQEFKACTSPLTVSVRKGAHTFTVQATDAGGNAGPAATDTFKVKRKKKKRK